MHVQLILTHLGFRKSYMLGPLYMVYPFKFVTLVSKNTLFGRRTLNTRILGKLGKLVYFGDNLLLNKAKKPPCFRTRQCI